MKFELVFIILFVVIVIWIVRRSEKKQEAEDEEQGRLRQISYDKQNKSDELRRESYIRPK